MSKRIITTNLTSEFSESKVANSQDSQKKLLADLRKQRDNKLRKFKASSCITPNSSFMGNDTIGLAPEYFVPQLENSSLELPRYRQEIVSWCDYYYQTNEYIGAAIDTHASMSVADFAISCKDKKIQQEYEDMLEDLDYNQLLEEIAYEYFRLGNVFPMGSYDEDNKTWKEFVIIPMLNIDLRKSVLQKDPKIYLVIDETLRQMSVSNDPNMQDEFGQLPEDIRNKINNNVPILVDPTRITHISTRSIAGTLWGAPPMFRCFKTLVYNDKIFRAQEAIADNQITPLKIISLLTPDGLPLGDDECEDFREQLAEASYDPNYFIVTSGTAKDNYIGSNGKILPLNSEMDMIERKFCAGLRVSKAILHGEGPTYANAQVYASTMKFYYGGFRNKLKRFLLRKVFKPIAEARGYYDAKPTERSVLSIDERSKRLILPELYFRGSELLDQQTINVMQALNDKKKISDETFISMVIPDIDYEAEKVKILRQESEKVTIKKVAPEIAESIDTPTAENVADSKTEEKLLVEDDKAKAPPTTKFTNPKPQQNI